jgi:intracellular sulfur oxidation DsrE/DsrF family protein
MKLHDEMAGAAAAIAALLLVAPSSEAQVTKKQSAQATKLNAVSKTNLPKVTKKPHRLILQVNSNEPAMMNLNNASNVVQYYKDLGEKVSIEVVTFGPGLHMLRNDTSPVKARIEALALRVPEISFKACGNTRENMSKAESKAIRLISEAKVVKSGVVRVMELQERGWTYVRP